MENAKKRDTEYYKIYKMLLLTGMRPCDLFAIKAGDFEFEDKILQFKVSKTQRTIDFPIYKELSEFIVSELLDINTMAKDETVFKKFNVDRIGKTFRKILKELELQNESYNLKTFRKTFASYLADKGLGEGDLADLLGHTSTHTTRQYYKRKNAGAIRSRSEGQKE
ncbi:MAG: tyrosine-type recombinase/integrase [Ignavibacteria bacterium]|nr:tyrosine-type recombinase/integrase [Ignavibacteria bacterium]